MSQEKEQHTAHPSGDQTPQTSTSITPSLRSNKDDEKSQSSTPGAPSDGVLQQHPPAEVRADGKRELKEWECWDQLAYKWPNHGRKCMYLSSIALIPDLYELQHIAARVGQMIYLVFYSFGCELWAPWSEEFGRWPILQLSLFLINIWQIPNSVAPNFGTIVVCRALGGLSTGRGFRDAWVDRGPHWALNFIVLSSTIGTSIGGVIGGPIERYLSWHWNFWIQLIFGVTVQAIHFFMPESRSTILIDREAKRRRETGEDPNAYGPNELKKPRISFKEAGKIWLRPFEMFVREPIVLFLSLLSGFSDALIFTFLEAFAITFPAELWFRHAAGCMGFHSHQRIVLLHVLPVLAVVQARRTLEEEERTRFAVTRASPQAASLNSLYGEPTRSFGFAWTCTGPPQTHWIAPMIFSFLSVWPNFAIYYSSVDYMIAAYGPYSASATGGNAFARDFLAGISAMYAAPLYHNLSRTRPSEYATTVLAGLSCLVVVPIYVFYWKGPQIRKASKFASILAEDRKAEGVRRLSKADNLQV
ncbi:hypothetical protein SNOG_14461 [Parastagonospora nodorum SN15]|uniref:Major facilitator superfamily (MFS) profile domain-containing protein n=1 Tax=Phaeosphaeria nodorum (strain SN15 / ATCC MYA-4574 / FGSC 10173) TaxID=321614 RepID=Q0U1S5_PHANO|nr:hypothetical protein SNOG_14461 [Parastagonospora nodorum SN15]EAT78332.2 hypothetical protein SNOG_14461 [Parastagonospora nodorum SN15]